MNKEFPLGKLRKSYLFLEKSKELASILKKKINEKRKKLKKRLANISNKNLKNSIKGKLSSLLSL